MLRVIVWNCILQLPGLFVDIGNNYSVLAHPNICFVYDYVGSKDEEKSQGDFVSKTVQFHNQEFTQSVNHMTCL